MRKNGINMITFSESVAHGIHSISVEHIKHFFGVDVPSDNGIPTINTDLNGPRLLRSAPKMSNDTKELSLTLKEVNFILSNNDEPQSFYIRGLSSIEKMTHIAHMDEIWIQAKKIFEGLKTNPPGSFACSCITNENKNGIKRELVSLSRKFRNFRPLEKRLTNSRNWKIWKKMMKHSMMSKHEIYHLSVYMFCKLNQLS